MLYIARWGRSATAAALCTAGLLTACEASSAIPLDAQVAPVVATAPPRAPLPHPPVQELGLPLGAFHFTMYYVAAERDYPPVEPAAANDNASSGAPDVSSGEPDSDDGADDGVDAADDATAGATPAATPRRRAVPLYHRKDCSHPIAMVDPGFEAQLDIQGTGKLRDGRVINTSGSCRCPNSPCYFEIGKAWAMGPAGKLSPFRSVAVDTDVVPLGSLLYVPILDGMQMPGHAPWGGWVHDGCVVAEDRGGGIKGRDIDFFVAKKVYSNLLDHRHHLKRVQVFDGKGWCERKDGKVQRAYRNAM